MTHKKISALQNARYAYNPKLPDVFSSGMQTVGINYGQETTAAGDEDQVKLLFPNTYGRPIVNFSAPGTGDSGQSENLQGKALRVGVILSGGQAPDGHNVIAGLLDGMKSISKDACLLGFLGGPAGLLKNANIEITPDLMDQYRNTGGFDIIGSGRTKISTEEQFAQALETVKQENLDAVVIIGGDDSNTNAAILAEYFLQHDCKTKVIGAPKTIDGDLKNEYIETSFGFDTAVKTYSELIGNIARDANSARKYWHFIRLMGRSASHITLECGLQTQPNICLISEEIAELKQTLDQIVETIVKAIVQRAELGSNFGLVLIPEGLIEFIPEMNSLIAELNDCMASDDYQKANGLETQTAWLGKNLGTHSATVFKHLPADIQKQLLMDRDPHGNVQVSRIETEKLLIEMVEARLTELAKDGKYPGTFSYQSHFFGYEGRCAFPSNFDADYCYSLGYTAFMLIATGHTGYISSVRNLHLPAEKWVAGGIPLTMMMNMEQRHGSKKPVIRKALVELNGAPFKKLKEHRERWAKETAYLFPGAIQYFGPPEVCDQPSITLQLERT